MREQKSCQNEWLQSRTRGRSVACLSPGATEDLFKLNSHQGCQRRANQRLHLGRNEVSDWLDARHSTFVRLGVNEPLQMELMHDKPAKLRVLPSRSVVT
ncbi:hypothetical protein TNCV_1321831 [Trichonephila clavipes]|nr:hypothetical protein TNCV_1321831 [Trichonephila clavipes]